MSRQSRRSELEVFGFSFLDVICCGFGAIVLLLLISKVGGTNEKSRDESETLQAKLFELNDTIKATELSMENANSMIESLRKEAQSLAAQQSKTQQTLEVAENTASTLTSVADRVQTALSQVSEEALQLNRDQERDAAVGGIPVDSEYIIFIIDTSGSMKYIWPRVITEIDNILKIHPTVKGIQIMNDMGVYMFKEFSNQWIPDSPGRRAAIKIRMAAWNVTSNSSPVEGVTAAIRQFATPDKRISIYVLGDEFTGNSITKVLAAISRANSTGGQGSPRARVHAVGFPSVLQYGGLDQQNTALRFAQLMRQLGNQNGGTFLALGR